MLGVGGPSLLTRAMLLNSSILATSVLNPDVAVDAKDKEKHAKDAAKAAYARFYRQCAAMLMSSDRATPPRRNTVHRMMRLVGAGGPTVKGSVIKLAGKDRYLHPTKGFRHG